MSDERKLPEDFMLPSLPGWASRGISFGEKDVVIRGLGVPVPLAPAHVRTMLPRLAEWLAIVDPEGEPKTPEPAPPVARPDLPPIKVRVECDARDDEILDACTRAIRALPVVLPATYGEAEARQAAMASQAEDAVYEWIDVTTIVVEFDLQAGTATVLRPERGGEA